MENHTTYVLAPKVKTNFNADGVILSGPSVIQRYQQVDYVLDYMLTKGDKQKPTNFAYRAMREKYWFGERRAEALLQGKWYTAETQIGAIDDVAGPTLSSRAFPNFPRVQSFHYNRALGRLNEKVRGQLDLSVSLLEAHETKQMLGAMHKATSYIGNTMKGISKGRKHDLIKDILRDAGGSYLQWHLAWEPIVNDLYSAVGEVYRHLTSGPLDITASSRSLCPDKLPLDKITAQDQQQYAQAIGKQGCRFHMRFIDKGGFDIRRYTSLNPLSLAWERVPLSFVFDYFYDLGGLLRNTETALLYDSQFVSGYYTELYALSASQAASMYTFVDINSRVLMNCTSSFEYKNFKRTVLGSYPLPRMPTFRTNLGSAQLLTLASLLAQQLR